MWLKKTAYLPCLDSKRFRIVPFIFWQWFCWDYGLGVPGTIMLYTLRKDVFMCKIHTFCIITISTRKLSNQRVKKKKGKIAHDWPTRHVSSYRPIMSRTALPTSSFKANVRCFELLIGKPSQGCDGRAITDVFTRVHHDWVFTKKWQSPTVCFINKVTF